MKELLITDNQHEGLEIKFDGERYWLTHWRPEYMVPDWRNKRTIILNPREIDAIVKFRNDTKEH